jgi:hypothetical protein
VTERRAVVEIFAIATNMSTKGVQNVVATPMSSAVVMTFIKRVRKKIVNALMDIVLQGDCPIAGCSLLSALVQEHCVRASLIVLVRKTSNA